MGSDRPAVLGKGAHAEPWGADPTTDSASEARDRQTAEVGRYFGVPTRILNAPAGDSETYSNVENDAIDLWRYTLRGYAGPVEDAISGELPGDPIDGRRMALDPARLLQGNLVDRSSSWAALVETGIADPDEARVKGFGLPARTPQATTPAPAAAGITVAVGG
jgi:phage portal protein BeeE